MNDEFGGWDLELQTSQLSKLRNSPKLPFHPYLSYLTDRRSLSVQGQGQWTAAVRES